MRLYLGGHLGFYKKGQGSWIEITLTQPAPLLEVISSQGIPHGEVHLVVLNGELVDLNVIVSEKDEVKLFSAVGGG
jgi:sulfur carrier protein ThiS